MRVYSAQTHASTSTGRPRKVLAKSREAGLGVQCQQPPVPSSTRQVIDPQLKNIEAAEIRTFARRDGGIIESLASARVTLTAHQALANAVGQQREPKRSFRLHVTVHYFPSIGTHEDRGRRHSDTVILDVGHMVNDAFPQHYAVRMARASDYFWHWTHLCTPFSFRTLSQQQLGLDQLRGESGFRQFGTVLCELAAAVSQSLSASTGRKDDSGQKPTLSEGHAEGEYQARVLVYEMERRCSLMFTETMSQMRTLPLLTLEFRPTSWSELKGIVCQHYRHIQVEHKEAQQRLARLISIIEREAPNLLVSVSCEQLNNQTSKAHKLYQKTQQLFSGLHNPSANQSASATPAPVRVREDGDSEEQNKRAEMTAAPNEKVLFARLVFLAAHATTSTECGNRPPQVGQALPASLEFHILATNPNVAGGGPTSASGWRGHRRTGGVRFMVTVTDPNDPLFFMSTPEISRDSWRRMLTAGMRQSIQCRSVHGEENAIGYLPDERLGGVVGVLRACLEQSHSTGRYQFRASLTENKTPNLSQTLASGETSNARTAQDCLQTSGSTIDAARAPSESTSARIMTVDIVERSKYRSETFLTLTFRDVQDERLKMHLARRIQGVEESLADVSHRLQVYTGLVRERKPVLLLQMPKLGIGGPSPRIAQSTARDPSAEQRAWDEALDIERKVREMRLQELDLKDRGRRRDAALWPQLLREGLYHHPKWSAPSNTQ